MNDVEKPTEAQIAELRAVEEEMISEAEAECGDDLAALKEAFDKLVLFCRFDAEELDARLRNRVAIQRRRSFRLVPGP